MATYYVRINGNDANNGTSAATAWRTWKKALGSTGISSGDTLYIGAASYGGIESAGQQEAIVSKRLFNRVQRKRKENGRRWKGSV